MPFIALEVTSRQMVNAGARFLDDSVANHKAAAIQWRTKIVPG